MISAQKQKAKEKYWKKVYDNAPMVECACGCGVLIKNKDKYGRDKKFINGHNNRKYSDPKQYKREWAKRNKDKKYTYKKTWIRQRKIKLINLRNNECSSCGFKFNGKNDCCFDFHHRIPKEKEFALSTSYLNYYNWKKVLKEFEKCDLVCALCHKEVPFGFLCRERNMFVCEKCHKNWNCRVDREHEHIRLPAFDKDDADLHTQNQTKQNYQDIVDIRNEDLDNVALSGSLKQ